MGLTDVLLPFLLIFSIMFAILSTIKLLGKRGASGAVDPNDTSNNNIYTFLSFAIALMVVVPHVTGSYPPGADVVEIINNFIPNMSVFIISIIMFLILLGIFGLKVNPKDWGTGVFVLFAMVAVGLIFGSSAGWFDMGLPPWLSFLNDPDIQALVLVVIMFFVVISLITGPDPKSKFKDNMKELFKNTFSNY
jgi:hypothetical protein